MSQTKQVVRFSSVLHVHERSLLATGVDRVGSKREVYLWLECVEKKLKL